MNSFRTKIQTREPLRLQKNTKRKKAVLMLRLKLSKQLARNHRLKFKTTMRILTLPLMMRTWRSGRAFMTSHTDLRKPEFKEKTIMTGIHGRTLQIFKVFQRLTPRST